MKAIVVYESLWGNTAAVARAIAEGVGGETRALSTAEATAEVISNAALIVAGAPVHAFRLPSDKTRESILANPGKAPAPPNLSHPSMRSWLGTLPKPKGHGCFAAFETRLWWSFAGATAQISRRLEHAGYRAVAKRKRFIVEGAYGPLRDGELERARAWGATLAQVMK